MVQKTFRVHLSGDGQKLTQIADAKEARELDSLVVLKSSVTRVAKSDPSNPVRPRVERLFLDVEGESYESVEAAVEDALEDVLPDGVDGVKIELEAISV